MPHSARPGSIIGRMSDHVASRASVEPDRPLRTSRFANGRHLARRRVVAIDWKYGLNLGQLGVFVTFLLAPMGWCAERTRLLASATDVRVVARWPAGP